MEIKQLNVKNFKSNDTNKMISEKSKIILRKSFLSCFNCLQQTAFLKQTDCCCRFVCKKCEIALYRTKCPSCIKILTVSESKIVDKVIMQSYTYCLVCAKRDTLKNTINHIILNHMEKEDDVMHIIKDDFITQILLNEFSFSNTRKFLFHDHAMNLVPKIRANDCRGGSFYKYPKCELLNEKTKLTTVINDKNNNDKELKIEKNGDLDKNFNPNINNPDLKENTKKYNELIIKSDDGSDLLFCNDLDNNSKIEKAKKFFRSFLYYYCETCDLFICNECQNINKIVYKAKPHVHNLSLIDRDHGWRCDARREETKCRSTLNNDRYWNSSGKTRFRCIPCDYDLCEKCMEFYMDYQVEIN